MGKIIVSERLRCSTEYPVGTYISNNLGIIEAMADEIMKEYGGEKLKLINFFARGSSGAIISGIVSSIMDKNGWDCNIYHVKKEGEKSHSNSTYAREQGLNVIIDDFISSGKTLNIINKKFVELTGLPIIDLVVVSGGIHSSCLEFNFKAAICGSGA